MLSPRLLAFFGLSAIMIAVQLAYKFTSTTGKMKFSPASALVLSEGFKFFLSMAFLSKEDGEHSSELGPVRAWKRLQDAASFTVVRNQCLLAVLYAANNNLSFFMYLYTGPATITMFKSFTTIYAALLLFVFVGRPISSNKWMFIVLQVLGVLIVQWNPCTGKMDSSNWAYFLLFLAATLTSFSSVINEVLIKKLDTSLHVLNAVMYAFGVVFNMAAFLTIPPPGTTTTKGFFEGFDMNALAVVLCNSLIGLAITAVYKYADVIVKTFASAFVTMCLLVLDAVLFGKVSSLTAYMGAAVVFIATYGYMTAAEDSKPEVVHTEDVDVEMEQSTLKDAELEDEERGLLLDQASAPSKSTQDTATKS